MNAKVMSIRPLDWILMPDFYHIIIDLPHSLSTEISGPGMRVSLASVGGDQVEIEGRIIFPKKPYELTELAVFKPHQAGLTEGSVWNVTFPTFPKPR
ncbi:MAG: hypothetical protein ABI353_14325 [Isosphaeraceae bacterium]